MWNLAATHGYLRCCLWLVTEGPAPAHGWAAELFYVASAAATAGHVDIVLALHAARPLSPTVQQLCLVRTLRLGRLDLMQQLLHAGFAAGATQTEQAAKSGHISLLEAAMLPSASDMSTAAATEVVPSGVHGRHLAVPTTLQMPVALSGTGLSIDQGFLAVRALRRGALHGCTGGGVGGSGPRAFLRTLQRRLQRRSMCSVCCITVCT